LKLFPFALSELPNTWEPGRYKKLVLKGAEKCEVQEERLITPFSDVGEGGIGLISKRLPTGWRLTPLKE
jgi:hypothetical protein